MRQSLCILVQYGLASFAAAKNGRIAEYTLLPEKVFSLLRYPRFVQSDFLLCLMCWYVFEVNLSLFKQTFHVLSHRYLYLIKTKFGVEAEMLVEEFLRSGYDSASGVIVRAASRLKETKRGKNHSSSKRSVVCVKTMYLLLMLLLLLSVRF